MYYEISRLSFVLELVTPLKPVVTSTPTKIRHPKKTKRREHEVAALSDEEETSVTSGSEGGLMRNWARLVFIRLRKICLHSNQRKTESLYQTHNANSKMFH